MCGESARSFSIAAYFIIARFAAAGFPVSKESKNPADYRSLGVTPHNAFKNGGGSGTECGRYGFLGVSS